MKVLTPSDQEAHQAPSLAYPRHAPLVTVLGVVEGEVLGYLETHGPSALRRVIRMLEWPASTVMMAVGALIREGLIRGVQSELEVILEPVLGAAGHGKATAAVEPVAA